MNVVINASALSMKSDAYVVKNPHETKNAFTITDVDVAADTLSLRSATAIEQLKESIKQYDFTSISTNELSKLGCELYHAGLLGGEQMVGFFIGGDTATDETGHQTKKDVKFNAIAMFNQKLEERHAMAGEYRHAPGFHDITQGLIRVNHAIAALSFFANSTRSDLSVSIKA